MRNRSFRRRYEIEFKGITTNNFMVKILDETMLSIVKAIDRRFKQVSLVRFVKHGPGEGQEVTRGEKKGKGPEKS